MPLLVAAGIIVFTIIAGASPAAAHGGGSDDTNYSSTITSNPDPDAMGWRVIAGDSLLQLENRSGSDVLVEGYEGEPYLQFESGGRVLENRRSPAVYLNQDRYADVDLPPDVDADAEPDWQEVSEDGSYQWHDHRIHWMAPNAPPAVEANPGEVVEIQRWTVPYVLDGERAELSGVLRYVPGPPWWPWLLGAAVVLLVPALTVTAVGRDRVTLRRLVCTGAVLAAAVAVADAVHQVDDLLAVPTTLSETVLAGLNGALVSMGTLYASWRAWSRPSIIPLIVAVILLLFGVGFTHIATLTSSQIATELPEWFSRAVVAANLAIVVPVAVVVFAAQRWFPIDWADTARRRIGA